MKKLLFYASAVAVLFSSCSKDATEDVVINSGNKVFTASIAMEDEQQTRMTVGDDNLYHWQVNDAIGVASKAAGAANILVTNTVNGTMPSFSVSEEDYSRWLDVAEGVTEANPLYVYFPFQPGTEFVDGEVSLTIPYEQRYAEGSFYRNTVPAVGFLEKYNGSETKVDLKVPVSLLQVWVAGFGKADEITLKIQKPGSTDEKVEYYNLSGTNTVDVVPAIVKKAYDYENYKPAFTEPTGNDAKDYVTVKFGQKPETMAYNGAMSVHFVIPAGIDLSEATLEFSCGDDTFKKKLPARNPNNKSALMTKPNGRMNLGSVKVQFGLDDKFLMSTEEEFLAYAYLVKPNAAKNFVKADYDYAADVFGVDIKSEEDYKTVAAVEALVIADELDFAAYGKEWADAKLKELNAEEYASAENAFWTNVLNWYIANNYAIESLSYNGVHGSSMTTIKNLNVLGSGLTAGASLSNLTLENVTVNAGIATTKTSGDKTTTTYSKTVSEVALIAANNDITTVAGDFVAAKEMKIENVIIGEGNKVVAANAGEHVNAIGGVYAKVNTTTKNIIASKNIKGIALDIYSKKDYTPIVGRLYAYTGLYTTKSFDLTDCAWDATQVSYPVIGEANSSIEAKGGVSSSMINAGVVGKVNTASYVYVDDVSYWNGKTVENDGNNKIFSAEELAYHLANDPDVATHNITLTNDINMQCSKTQVVTTRHFTSNVFNVTTTETAESTAKNPIYNEFEIKNVIATNSTATASLFGANATVANISLTNVTINATAATTAVAGLAIEGSAKNVNIDGLTINIDKGVAAKSIKSIGGVFAEADVNDIDDVNVKTLSLIYAGTKNLGARAGIIAGTLNIEPNSEAKLKAFNCGAKNHTFTNIASEQKDGADKNGNFYTVYATSNNYGAALPFGTISVNNAAANGNGNTKAYLKLTEANFGSMTRLAAGVVFSINQADLKAKTAVRHDAAAIDSYKYVFISDGKIAQQNTVFGFTAK